MDKVLVDTSVWIEFFKRKEPYFSIVSELMDSDLICCAGLIYAELLQGALTDKELNTIKEFIHVFDFVNDSVELWEKAGELSYALHRKGRSIGLSDCYIAVISQTLKLKLLTLDKHFKIIQKEIELNILSK